MDTSLENIVPSVEVSSKKESDSSARDESLVVASTNATAGSFDESAEEMEDAVNELIWKEWSDIGQMNYTDHPPTRHVTQLKVGVKYPIVGFRRIEKKDLVIMDSEEFGIFLPKRLVNQPLPKDVSNRFFVVRGFKPCKNDKNKVTPLLDFVL